MKKFLSKVSRWINRSYDLPLWKWLLLCFLLAFMEEFLLEILGRRSLVDAFSFIIHTPLIFLYNILIVFFTLTLALLSRRRGFLVGFITFLWLLVGVTNCIVLGYRITPFSAIDVLMVKDMLSMINIYFNIFQIVLLVGGILAVLVFFVVAFLKVPKVSGRVNYIANLTVCVVTFLVLAVTTYLNLHSAVIARKFTNLGTAYKDYGFAYCFSNSVVDVGISKPEGYDENQVDQILDRISTETDASPVPGHKKPNIVIVQLESFIDIARAEGIHTDKDPIPNFHKLQEEYPSGYLTVPAIGAGTANTEFEILTGMKSKLFGAGEYPYKTVLTKTPCESMPQELLRQGYGTHAIHNNKAKFYSRDESYSSLGFQTFTSLEYMTNATYTNTGWAKDECLTSQIMQAMDSDDNPDIVMTISVQGHGKYPKDELNCTEHVKVTLDSQDPELTNQFGYYVNQTYEMDLMIKELKKALDDRGEDYILLLYGDHIPSLTFDNNPITRGQQDQTEYVLVSNFNLNLPDQDLYAYEMSDVIMTAAGLKRGVMQKAHEAYFDPADPSKFDDVAHVLQYDMLYGDQYTYQRIQPYERADMKMGVVPIEITSVMLNPVTGNLLVRGQNFTTFSRVLLDDDRMTTTYVDSTLLLVESDDVKGKLQDGTKISVAQIDKNKHELTRTESVTYPPDN